VLERLENLQEVGLLRAGPGRGDLDGLAFQGFLGARGVKGVAARHTGQHGSGEDRAELSPRVHLLLLSVVHAAPGARPTGERGPAYHQTASPVVRSKTCRRRVSTATSTGSPSPARERGLNRATSSAP